MKKLYRSPKDMYIGGVCGGLGETLKIDSNIIRVIFVLFAVFGAGVIIYLIMWAILPLKSINEYSNDSSNNNGNNGNDGTINMEKGKDDTYKMTDNRNLHFFGTVLIFIGVLLLVNNLFLSLDFHKVWPLIIIFIGVIIMFSREKK